MTNRAESDRCGGKWANCPNAFRTLDKGYPVMRCKLTGKHPDECRERAE